MGFLVNIRYQRFVRLLQILSVAVTVSIAHSAYGFSDPKKYRQAQARQDINVFVDVLEAFFRDHGRYPTDSEGLDALIVSAEECDITAFPFEDYLTKLPLDPWRNEYQYLAQGKRNPDGFDVYTLGADGQPGGTGVNADLGNWPASDSDLAESRRKELLWTLLILGGLAMLFGFLISLPPFILGCYMKRRDGYSAIKATKGLHLLLLIYLTFIVPAGLTIAFWVAG